ncbi:MAG: F0F1 ATP synthase subunit A, partial [Deltaproteobacteria bacterium]|nr:F0F1 ATP synthase subunit A [Deltaproteobacteria bacterium]
MEHPIFFIDHILSALGLSHFAFSYSHVTHTWFVMIILIGAALLFARGVQLLPTKGQN